MSRSGQSSTTPRYHFPVLPWSQLPDHTWRAVGILHRVPSHRAGSSPSVLSDLMRPRLQNPLRCWRCPLLAPDHLGRLVPPPLGWSPSRPRRCSWTSRSPWAHLQLHLGPGTEFAVSCYVKPFSAGCHLLSILSDTFSQRGREKRNPAPAGSTQPNPKPVPPGHPDPDSPSRQILLRRHHRSEQMLG